MFESMDTQFNKNPEKKLGQNPDIESIAKGVEEELEKMSENPEVEKPVVIEMHLEKPEEITEVEPLEFPKEKQALICPNCLKPLDASGKCQTTLCERNGEVIAQPRVQQEREKLVPSSANLTEEQIIELEQVTEERDKRFAAEMEKIRVANLAQIRELEEAKKFETPSENPELIMIKEKMQPVIKEVEQFMKNYRVFAGINPSVLNPEIGEEKLRMLGEDREKLVSHIASNIIKFYLENLTANEKSLWIEGLEKFTSGATKIAISEALRKQYDH